MLNGLTLMVVAVLWWHALLPSSPSPSEQARFPALQEIAVQVSTRKMYAGNPARRWIALTFDDGPHPYHTPILLKTLRELGVRATFFVVGKNVDRYPELVRQMVQDGHEVENHTYHHLRLSQVPLGTVRDEIEAGASAIWRATGHVPRFVRPPGGMIDRSAHAVAQSESDVVVMWTQDPADYERPDADTLKRRLFESVRPGSIILLHEKVPVTVEVLPEFVREMRRRGYEFVTIEEMWRDMQEAVVRRTVHPRGGLPSPFLGGS